MANEQKKYWTDDPELVEKYVLGQLSDEERKRLDAEIADCEPCKAALQRELQLTAGIRRHGRDQLKSRLRLKLRREQSQQIFRYQFIGLAAAVIVIAIGVGVYQVWFSDVMAPKKFNNKEIVLKQESPPVEPERERASTEESKDAGKMEKRDVATTPSAAGGSSQSSSTRKETGAPSKEGFVKTESPAAEIAESTAPAKPKRNVPTRSIWLIGKVIMVDDQPSAALSDVQPQALMSEQAKGKKQERFVQPPKRISIRRDGEEEQIVLQQRSFRDLPRSRQTQIARKNLVETLVQQSEEGLSLTIYSDAISAAEIEHATVEIAGSDSLIVETGTQRIYYKLPASFQQSTRIRR